jgi:hypothetical protein
MEASGKDKDDSLEFWYKVYSPMRSRHHKPPKRCRSKISLCFAAQKRKGIRMALMDPRTLYCEDSLWGTAGKPLLYA